MKRFDAASVRLVIGATALALLIAAIPVLQNGRKGDEIWKAKDTFYDRASVICDAKSSSVITYDRLLYRRFDLTDGKRLKVWSPSKVAGGTYALTSDGLHIVSVKRTVKGTGQIVIYDAESQAVLKQIALKGDFTRTNNSITLMSSRFAVVRQSGKGADLPQLVDLEMGKVSTLSSSIIQESITASAMTPKGELQFGWFEGEKLHFETVNGKITELPLDPDDSPTKPNRSDWAYFVPTMLFESTQNNVFASIQCTIWPNAGLGVTGSVCAWNWSSQSLLWRWQETETQPVAMALSPDESSLAVGCTVPIPTTYRRGVRLVILDTKTGAVKQEIRRNRGGSESWQQFAEKVRRTPDEVSLSDSNMPSVVGLDWTDDGQSLVVAYGDGEVIRWRM